MTNLTVIGGGLAGCEAAWQAAERGLTVDLYEMRPLHSTGAHVKDQLAELVCSNSLGSNLPDRAAGVLKAELRRLDSLLLNCAEATAVPAGAALAVDRDAFARLVTEWIQYHPRIRVLREEVTVIPDGLVIVASGPLTSPGLASDIARLAGQDNLFFFDAIAPIITLDSINIAIAYRASRREQDGDDDGDYINCPLNKDQYYAFVDALISAERIELRSFEAAIADGVKAGRFFEGCLPVEIIAARGKDSLAYGPLRPVGLRDPRTGRHPFAVVQLRQDNLAGSLYNMVGFQTNLKHPEQQRVFRMIPGLEKAEFARYGQMHRNTFIASPQLLHPTLQFAHRPDLFFAGQITGIEGYVGNIASGLLAGINAAHLNNGMPLVTLPATTMLGALCDYITHAELRTFQPMKANFGILPALESPVPHGKRERAQAFAKRALVDLDRYLQQAQTPIP
ncbi:MAG TPA: methylenetetrahydrofolate--tRNA-(uracil(54)-C(5))-methyltransferase (FADH(2)-oxidizing) TrmFO [Anaerolineales bacterium]|nr:methylenetetrahydrofolate--tRNA-(uracil(54)-C(5))-methyltransferase (FADH(2)-oxidizing) TrmFO [Anaerolineales bacterium]